MPLRKLPDPHAMSALDRRFIDASPAASFMNGIAHPPRVLLLYGSLRERSYSRLAIEEAARLLRLFGAEPRIFNPSDLPMPDRIKGDDHPAVRELRELSIWSEAHVWCSPERHGQITGVMKAQIDHLPLNMAASGPRKAERWPLCKFPAGRNPSTPSIHSAILKHDVFALNRAGYKSRLLALLPTAHLAAWLCKSVSIGFKVGTGSEASMVDKTTIDGFA